MNQDIKGVADEGTRCRCTKEQVKLIREITRAGKTQRQEPEIKHKGVNYQNKTETNKQKHREQRQTMTDLLPNLKI